MEGVGHVPRKREGAISFGLVNIPVELHPAEDRKSFEFSMLDKRGYARPVAT